MPKIVYLLLSLTGVFYALMIILTKFTGLGAASGQGLGGFLFVGFTALFFMQCIGKDLRVWSWWLLPVLGVGSNLLFIEQPLWKQVLIEMLYLSAIAAALGYIAKKGT